MITLIGKSDKLEGAELIRTVIMETLPQIIEKPHIPELNQDEKETLLKKLDWLAKNEHRASFYLMLTAIRDLKPGTAENPTRLTNTLLGWAGKTKKRQYQEPRQKIPDCKNGRIIRDARGL